MEKCQWVTLVTDNLPWPLYEGAQDPKASSSEWTCLWALNDVLVLATAFLLGNAVSLAVPITWFISQVSWSNAGLGKGGRWWGADICRIGPVCWTLGCWSSCSRKKKKRYHTSFQIITGAFQHVLCSIYVYVCLFSQFKRIYSLDESCSDIIPHLCYLPNCPVLIQ